MQYVDLFFEKGGYDFLYSLEERYSCASICQVPLFYLVKDVAEGPPETDCFTAAVEDITNNETAAIIFLVSAVILFVAMLGGFPLCCKAEGKKEEETGRRKNYEVEGEANKMH